MKALSLHKTVNYGRGKVKYAIGDQDFRSLRENGFLYVDKTEYIEKLLEGSKYYSWKRYSYRYAGS